MPVHDELGIRMKTFYEQIPKTRLMRRCPVIIRIDGKTHHSYTKGFQKPFDEVYTKSMQETAKYLCENIQGCVLSYQQSDEISLVLVDYKKLNSSAWFDYEVEKMCSIAASMATMAFNKFFMFEFEEFNRWVYEGNPTDNEKWLNDVYYKAMCKGAMFDARVFNIPKEEVTNYIYWRQNDAIRNSIQMVGQANFSHKELQNKSCNDIQDMLMTQKGINWNDFPTYQKRGSCCIKEKYFIPYENGKHINLPEGCADPSEDPEVEKGTWRTHWIIDKDIPIFKGINREYIDKLMMF